jgi:hypothetical protein
MSITETILKRIEKYASPCVFFIGDFTDICDAEYARKVLSLAQHGGIIERLAPGIYCKSKQTKFGKLNPSLYEIAETIAKRDHVKILPTGSAALNQLGISTQVPTNTVYLTTGSPRTVKIGNRNIKFIHGVPRNFIYSSRLFALLVQSLRNIGKDRVSEEDLLAIQTVIMNNPEEIKKIRRDIGLSPVWMQKLVMDIIK